MYKEYDVVKTVRTVHFATGTLKRGSKGTIVEIYKSKAGTGYHVEFADRHGKTRALLILNEGDISPIFISDSDNEAPKVIPFRRPAFATAAEFQNTPASGPYAARRVASKSASAKPAAKAVAKPKVAAKSEKKIVAKKSTRQSN